MRKLALVSLLALIVAPVASAAFSGDVIWAANTRYNSGLEAVAGSTGKGTELAISAANFNAGSEFFGGCAAYDAGDSIGLGSSELLGDSDGQWGGSTYNNNVTAMSRSILNYDGDTFLELAAGKWGAHNNVWLTQLEYDASASFQNAAVAVTDGFGVWVDQTGATPNSGGQLTGKLQFASDTGFKIGVDPRLAVDDGSASAFSMLGSEDVWAMAADDAGDLYIAGRDMLDFGNGKIVKMTAPGTLANAAGSRLADVAGTPSVLYSGEMKWYTGIVESQGVLLAVDRGLQNIDAIDATTGALLGTYAFSAELSVTPEDLAILDEGNGSVRVVVDVLDAIADVKLAVLDVDLANVAGASVVNLLTSGDLPENGAGASLNRVDAVYVSPEGDIVTQDSRDSNDDRYNVISAEALAAVLTGDGTTVNVGTSLQYIGGGIAGFNYGRGMAFTPEPASLAMLVMGGLALIRRRK